MNKNSLPIITLGRWQVVKEENLLICGDEMITLLPKVMKALEYFINHPQQTITFDELNNAIWPNEFVGDNSIYNIIGQLRKALGDVASKPIYIETISKKGYRLIANVKVSGIDSKLESENTSDNTFLIIKQSKVIFVILSLVLFSLLFTNFYQNSDSLRQIMPTAESEKIPTLAKQFHSLAKYHQFKGNKDNKLIAIDYYKKLLALVPENLQAYQEIAFLNIELMSLIPLEKKLFYRKAKLAANKAKSIDKKQGNTLLLLSYLMHLENKNSDSEALELNFKALEDQLFNISISGRLAYADYLFKEGKINEAIKQQELSITECVTCAEIYRKLATSYMVNLELDEAAKYFDQHNELSAYDYSDPIKMVSQGILSIQTLGEMYQWLAKNPKKLELNSQLNYLTLFYLNVGQFDKANKLTTKRNISDPSDFFTLYTLAAESGARQDFKQSLTYLKKRHELFPLNRKFSLSLSIAYWMQDDIKVALSILMTQVISKKNVSATQVNLSEPDYTLFYAALLKENGQKIKAEKLLLQTKDNILKQTVIGTNSHMDLAITFALLGENEKAIASIKIALDSGWVSDFNLNWWRLEDNPFLSSIKNKKEFQAVVINYYAKLNEITSTGTDHSTPSVLNKVIQE